MTEKRQQILFDFPYRSQLYQFLVDYKAKHNERIIIKDLMAEAVIEHVKNKYDVDLTQVEVRDRL